MQECRDNSLMLRHRNRNMLTISMEIEKKVLESFKVHYMTCNTTKMDKIRIKTCQNLAKLVVRTIQGGAAANGPQLDLVEK